jgi:hypothetical protein
VIARAHPDRRARITSSSRNRSWSTSSTRQGQSSSIAPRPGGKEKREEEGPRQGLSPRRRGVPPGLLLVRVGGAEAAQGLPPALPAARTLHLGSCCRSSSRRRGGQDEGALQVQAADARRRRAADARAPRLRRPQLQSPERRRQAGGEGEIGIWTLCLGFFVAFDSPFPTASYALIAFDGRLLA